MSANNLKTRIMSQPDGKLMRQARIDARSMTSADLLTPVWADLKTFRELINHNAYDTLWRFALKARPTDRATVEEVQATL